MRFCFWSTTFQSDCHALADHLARSGHHVTVAMPRPQEFLREPIHQLVPLCARVLERDAPATEQLLKREPFDVLIVDNHLPSFPIAPKLFVLWHGFGWRVDDLSTMRGELKKLIGDVTRANPHFRWRAVGEWDREYRVSHSKLAEDNVVALGSAFSDWLRPHSVLQQGFDRRAVQHAYAIDLDKPVVLVALTWHHGGAFGHWGDEEQLLARLVQHVAARGGSTLLRMHDRQRYTPEYIRVVNELAASSRAALMLKWKSDAPDSALDLLVSDVCISNYSSLLNDFYHTERPSIHVDPHDSSREEQTTYRMFCNVLVPYRVSSRDQLWKLPPEEHGGLRSQSFDELIAHVDRAIARPDCCGERARAFLRSYVTQADGQSCARTAQFLEQWLATERPASLVS